MNLPVRIQTRATDARVLSVDGAFGAPGLNLSHWPGNTTPADLAHDLSTGIALNFARLDAEERDRRAAGCTALVNNHYDTDGLCAMLAVLQPELALAHADALLDAAWAGDFFRRPSAAAFAIDCIVTAAADVERSPFATDLRGLEDSARHEVATRAMLERLPALLDGELEPYSELWKPALEDVLADASDLAACTFDDLVHLDFASWTAPGGQISSRPSGSVESFDPGRHAFFEATRADRVLVAGPGASGTSFRFVIGTASFFDLASRTPQARPELAALAERLNGLEGTEPGSQTCWRHQSQTSASPELWFGTDGLPLYAEHAATHLAPSALDVQVVKREVVDALRATWIFPTEEEDEDEESWASV
ncbi:MAG: hypothetical protein GY711_04870 [bacterium]|nr:hypothetical protein [bacterium]